MAEDGSGGVVVPSCEHCGMARVAKLISKADSKFVGQQMWVCPNEQAVHPNDKCSFLTDQIWRSRLAYQAGKKEHEEKRKQSGSEEESDPKRAKQGQSSSTRGPAGAAQASVSPSDKAFVEEVQQLKKLLLENLEGMRKAQEDRDRFMASFDTKLERVLLNVASQVGAEVPADK